jgi:hypothetical protein
MTITDITRALATATTRMQGHEILAPLSASDLRAVADALSVRPRTRKADLATAIVEATVGMRLDHAAIRGGW